MREAEKDVLSTLVAARALVAEEEHWCKGTDAQTKDGFPTTPYRHGERNPEAMSFCAVGAIDAVRGKRDPLDPAYTALAKALPKGRAPATGYNDDDVTTHADILAWYDRAIEAVRREALEALAMAEDMPDAAVLDAIVRQYPQFSRELTEFAVELALDSLVEGGADEAAADPTTVSPAVSRAMSAFHNRLYGLRQAGGAAVAS